MNFLRIAARIIADITYKSMPEYADIDAFAEYMMGEEMTEFSHEDLQALNYRTRTPVGQIRKELESYGFMLKHREPEKRTRGFQTNDNDRYYGPGSENSHGGSGFSNFE
jgi:hypothetical protein